MHAYLGSRRRTHPTSKYSHASPCGSQECYPYRDSMCLTIDKPFFAALICGKCLNNVHGKADNSSCFEIGGRQMESDNQ